jgi:hypothetical protein
MTHAAGAIDIAELLAIEEFGWCDREDLTGSKTCAINHLKNAPHHERLWNVAHSGVPFLVLRAVLIFGAARFLISF